MAADALVSIGLPVRNGAQTLGSVVQSVLDQDHADLELVISDNASTDDTEEVCRALAQSDSRIVYQRQPENIGLLNNFLWTKAHAKGTYFRWIGDDDYVSPSYVSRCLQVFEDDPRLIVVTTQLEYIGADEACRTMAYDSPALRSDDPVTRFAEMLRLVTESYLLLDPVYAMLRPDAVATIPYFSTLHGDESFAAKMALAGPWGHVPEVLGHRHWQPRRRTQIASLLGAPSWQVHTATLLQCRELLDHLRQEDLTAAQRRRARNAVMRFYVRRHWRTAQRRTRKLGRRQPY